VAAAAARRHWRKMTTGWAFMGRAAEKPPRLVQGFWVMRVVAQRAGRRERAGLEGKEARRLLGWVEVGWTGWAKKRRWAGWAA
jgi:hypothetical protein